MRPDNPESMVKLISLLSIVFSFFGCVNHHVDKECTEWFVGNYILDTKNSGNSVEENEIIRLRGWDTIKLISKIDGTYYFDTKDSIIKKSEGIWYVKVEGNEGECHGYIKQKNLEQVNCCPFQIYFFIGENRKIYTRWRKF